MDYENVVVLAM